MKDDKIYRLLKKRMIAVSDLPPQRIGPFTGYWRKVIPYVKTMPLKILLPTGFLSSILLWLILGSALVRIVSLLQYGF